MVGGLQLLVARDGGSAGRDGGGGGGTNRGAVLGSGGAKEVAQPGGDLAVGGVEKGGGGESGLHRGMGWWCCWNRLDSEPAAEWVEVNTP